MAYVQAIKNKSGDVTSYRVRWRTGGTRTGSWQAERFTDPEPAEVFRTAVDEAGQQWPAGWVKGQGYIAADAGDTEEDRYRFRAYATRSIDNRTGIEEHYRQACLRDLERYILPTFGECDVRSTEHFSQDTVRAWVRVLEQTKVHRGQVPTTGRGKLRPMSPKTIRNLHGLLSSILQEAVRAEPPLRARNPCEGTRLPRTDDDGGEDGEDIEFLTPAEVEGLVAHLTKREDQLLVRVAYGTGLRWGELTALAPMCVLEPGSATPKLRVRRAWKKDGKGGYYIGKPKSPRSRRTVRVTRGVVGALEELGMHQLARNALFFTGSRGQRLHYSTFHDRWKRAVRAAKLAGSLPSEKSPTPHDLRHSHAAALISAGHSLTYVQRRLGHESIKTTSDTYGHLLPEADEAAMATIERALGGGRAEELDAEQLPPVPERPVYVAYLGQTRVGFWAREIAEDTAAGWARDAGGPVRVETWSLEWWQRQTQGGVHEVRSTVPDRAWVWSVGPAVYADDGTQLAAGPGAHELSGRWLWEFERGYTGEPAESRVGWVEGEPVTEAAAWGIDRDAVLAAFEEGRVHALRVCGLNPEVGAPVRSSLRDI